MKKIFILLFVVLIMEGCGVKEKPNPNSDTTNVIQEAKVKLTLDDGEGVATYSAEIGPEATVLEVLTNVTQEKGIKLGVKTYDFGALVESIGDKNNSKERAWIYFINGQAGNVGAGEKRLNRGDVVEWKYMAPIY